MNVFAVSDDVYLCAQALDDKRLVKMLTETCQILSAARIVLGKPAPYKVTHVHHPVIAWATQTFQHRCWLGAYITALYTEYCMRFSNKHAAWDKCGTLALEYAQRLDPLINIQFVNCARHKGLDVDFSEEPNVFVAYRLYLRARWKLAIANPKAIPTWTNRLPPAFAGKQLMPYLRRK